MYSNIPSLEIDAEEIDYLYYAESQIKDAGNGLYTAIKIFKSEVIAIFKGELISKIEQKKRTILRKDSYFISLLNGRVMDSMETECFAKYANDAEGITPFVFRNNAIISLNEKDQVCLIAIRNIKAKEEIFCNYGKAYWEFRKQINSNLI